jgi:hypothetical protein
MQRDRADRRGIAAHAGLRGLAQQLGMNAVMRSQCAQIHDPPGRLANDGGEPLEQRIGHLRVARHRFQESRGGESCRHRVVDGDDIGGARRAIDGRELAEIAAGLDIVEADLAPAQRVIHHAHAALDHEIDIGRLGLAIDDLLARGESAPAAAPLDRLAFGGCQRRQQADTGQGSGRGFAHGVRSGVKGATRRRRRRGVMRNRVRGYGGAPAVAGA